MDKCVDKLKCSICNNHLSYFPIYQRLDNKNFCGRCESNTKTFPLYMRNEMYEIVAQFLEFPCRYHREGCQKKLIPSEVPTHEKSCIFRVSQCPTESITGCVEEIPNRDLIQHCQEKHSDFILKDYKFEIDLSHSYQIKNLLLHEDTLLIATKKFCLQDNTFEYLINGFENENNSKIYSYRINLRSDNRTFSINCIVDDCKNNKICLDIFKNFDNNDFVVFCEIIIQNTKNASNSCLTNYKTVHEQLFVNLKCSNCTQNLIPPSSMYYQNVTCSQCKTYNTFGLNDLATFLYRCNNQKNGCNFAGTPAEIENHKIFCSFAKCECPINEYVFCTWQGLSKDMVEHVKEIHHIIIVECTKIFKFSYAFNCYIIKFSNRLFRLVFTKNGDTYIWLLQLIGHFAEKYKYDIEMVNNDDSRKLQMRQLCLAQPLIKKNQICQIKDSYSCIVDEQVQNFLGGEHFTFKVHILT